jgi:hypothetical protein
MDGTGLRDLLARARDLAVSVHHRPRDLWEPMLQVDRMGLDYQFHLRSRAFNSFETVLYAIPQ